MDNSRDLQDIALEYWYLLKDIQSAGLTFNFYGLNQKRIEIHDELCEALGLFKEETTYITDNLDQFKSFDDFYNRLLELKRNGAQK